MRFVFVVCSGTCPILDAPLQFGEFLLNMFQRYLLLVDNRQQKLDILRVDMCPPIAVSGVARIEYIALGAQGNPADAFIVVSRHSPGLVRYHPLSSFSFT